MLEGESDNVMVYHTPVQNRMAAIDIADNIRIDLDHPGVEQFNDVMAMVDVGPGGNGGA